MRCQRTPRERERESEEDAHFNIVDHELTGNDQEFDAQELIRYTSLIFILP